MGLITGALLVVVLLIAALAALNWGLLVAPTLMSLGFTCRRTRPSGLVMLGLTVLLGVLLRSPTWCTCRVRCCWRRGVTTARCRPSATWPTRPRPRASPSCAPSWRRRRPRARPSRRRAARSRAGARRRSSRPRLRQRAEQTDNSLAAHIGQLEDRLERRPAGIGRHGRRRRRPDIPSARLRRSPRQWGVASTQVASALASASLTWLLAGIGTGPQTPAPPFMILAAQHVGGALVWPLYFAATSLKAGPSTFALDGVAAHAVLRPRQGQVGARRVPAMPHRPAARTERSFHGVGSGGR